MSNKFLTVNTGLESLQDGTAKLRIGELTIDGVDASSNVRTNISQTLEAGDVDISEVNGLQSALDDKIDRSGDGSFVILGSDPAPPAVGNIGIYAKGGFLYTQSSGANVEKITTSADTFDQSLNTTDSVTFADLTLNTSEVVLGDGANSDVAVRTVIIGDGAGGGSIGNNSVSVGRSAGFGTGESSVSIGNQAGFNAGDNSISIGFASIADTNSIVINANNATKGSGASNEIHMVAGTSTLFVDGSGLEINGVPVSGGGGVTNLQQAYEGSPIDDQIVTDATSGALEIRTGSGADTDKQFTVKDTAGGETTTITGDGTLSVATLLKSPEAQCNIYNNVLSDATIDMSVADTIDFQASNVLINGSAIPTTTFDQSLNTTDSPSFAGLTMTGDISNLRTDDNNIILGLFASSGTAECVSIGSSAGGVNQGSNCVAIGDRAGGTNQGNNSVALGTASALTGQGVGSVAIGVDSGVNNQGSNCVAIGSFTGTLNQPDNSVIVGGSGLPLNLTSIGDILIETNNGGTLCKLGATRSPDTIEAVGGNTTSLDIDGTANSITLTAGTTSISADATSLDYNGSAVATESFVSTGYIPVSGGSVLAGTLAPTSDETVELGSLTNKFSNIFIGGRVFHQKDDVANACFLQSNNTSAPSVADQRAFKVCNRAVATGNVLEVLSSNDAGATVKTNIALEHTTGNVSVGGNLSIAGGLTFPKPWGEIWEGIPILDSSWVGTDWHKALFFSTTQNANIQGFTHASPNRLIYTGAMTKNFHSGITVTFEASNNATTNFEFALFKNGVITPGSTVAMTTTNSLYRESTAIHKVVELATNDYIELWVRRISGTADLTIAFYNMFTLALPNEV